MIDANGLIMTATASNTPARKPTTPVITNYMKGGEVISWGKNNKLPDEILADIRRHPSLQSILQQKGRLLYGYGCFLGKVSEEADGMEKITPLKDAKVQAFLERAGFEKYIRQVCLNYFRLENVFPEIILTKDRSEVYAINPLKAAFCRLGIPSAAGIIDQLYYSSCWGGTKLPSDFDRIPVLNEYDPLYDMRSRKEYKYIYRPKGLDPEDGVGYTESSWGAIRSSNWLDVAKQIPLFKATILNNQTSIKYHIKTTAEWWEWKYPGFLEKKMEEKVKIMASERQAFENTMTGPDNAGKSIFTTGYMDRNSNKFIPGWEIEPLTNKLGSSDYIEDMQEAISQILIALQIPAALVGHTGGKKMGAGSGSDIREAYNMYQSMQEIERDLILEPWYDAMKYNGYSDEIRLVFRYPQLTTLDKNVETQTIDSHGL